MTIIAMSEKFKKRPSEILNIENDYEAYCFDEVCLYYLSEATEEKTGKRRWDRLHFKEKKTKGNKDFVQFLEKQK